LITLGTLSLFLGTIGIFIPGLPTTPFLLLTAALYVRSSDRLYARLIKNKYVGPKIAKFRQEKGMDKATKLWSIFLMWLMIGISVHFLLDKIWIKFVTIGLGIIGTVVMGFIIPTVHKRT